MHPVSLSLPVLCHGNLHQLEGTQGSEEPSVQTEKFLLGGTLTSTLAPPATMQTISLFKHSA